MKGNKLGSPQHIVAGEPLGAGLSLKPEHLDDVSSRGISHSIAEELTAAGYNIVLNGIEPAKQIPDTSKARCMIEERVIRNVLLAAQPTKEFATVEEMAALAVFLCSDWAASITGTALPLDGGWTAY